MTEAGGRAGVTVVVLTTGSALVRRRLPLPVESPPLGSLDAVLADVLLSVSLCAGRPGAAVGDVRQRPH